VPFVLAFVSFNLIAAVQLRAETRPTFYRDIAPILEERCQVCHRPGEIAPFPLVSYRQTALGRR
jgi:hypothetical protein